MKFKMKKFADKIHSVRYKEVLVNATDEAHSFYIYRNRLIKEFRKIPDELTVTIE